ncbi:MAG: DNA-binding response regulator [Acidobacteria bacterium]|nr:MAG: DNA-binding response regulator [Acidobacteriota bacterium]REK04283.1 MAG: DNA-binding response regulator [Acidobacteriota bacterium]
MDALDLPAVSELEIVVVGPSSLAREALGSLLEHELSARLHKVEDGAGALRLLDECQPSALFVLSDELDGLHSELLRSLRAAMPESSQLVWIGCDREVEEPPEIVDAALSLHDAPDALFAPLEGRPEPRPRRWCESAAEALGALTERELVVLDRMARGITSNRGLATELGVSENTVKFHVRNILGKLGLHKRAQVVAYALSRRDPGWRSAAEAKREMQRAG